MNYLISFQFYSLSNLLGLWLTIFYKKDFKFKEHFGTRLKMVIMTIISALFWAFGLFYQNQWAVIVVVSGLTFGYVIMEMLDLVREELIKSIVLGFTVFLVFYLSVDSLAPLAVVCAITQLLRWPTRLKNYLREPRIIFGPVYALLAIGAWIKSDLTSYLLFVSEIAVFFASIFLRPDNNELLQFLVFLGLSIPSAHKRKMAHGFLMFLSMICLMVYLLMSSSVREMAIAVTLFVGVINVVFYVFVADFPRKVWNTLARMF